MAAQTALALVNPASLFDYAALDRAVEVAARSDAALIKSLMRRTADDIIEIGAALIRQRTALPDGTFKAWIESEFNMSRTATYRFINVAERFSSCPTVGHLQAKALYELAAPSTPPEVQAEVERRITAGELVTAADIRELKDDYAEVVQIASEKTAQLTAAEQNNHDLVANAHRLATEESEKKYVALIDDLKKRAELAEQAASASIEASATDDNVVMFQPAPTDEQPEADPLGDGVDDIDLNDQRVGAHVIYGSLSSIDLAQTTPEVFWTIFGTPNGKAGTKKWLLSTLKKLNAIKKGMPE
jgi:hypothetical protein